MSCYNYIPFYASQAIVSNLCCYIYNVSVAVSLVFLRLSLMVATSQGWHDKENRKDKETEMSQKGEMQRRWNAKKAKGKECEMQRKRNDKESEMTKKAKYKEGKMTKERKNN